MGKANTTVCKTGYIKCNKRRYWDAALILFRPGYGIIRVAYGAGGNLTDEDLEQRDRNNHKIDDYLYITVYQKDPRDDSFRPLSDRNPEKCIPGLLFEETDGGQLLFSHKSWPNGDIREMLPEAFDFMGWPKDVKGYYLIGYDGQFWDRPLPLGVRKRSEKC